MQDKDAANSIPGGGNLSIVNKLSTDEAPVFVNSPLERQEKPKTQYRILVVEDDSSLAHLEANFLAAYGYTVMIADSGEIAVTTLNSFIPDLVVLDIELPGLLTGWDVLQLLRQRARIPVLLTTSLTPDIRKYLRTHGETRLTLDHLAKPYPMQTLLKRVKRMLMIAPQ
jgi:DNA-binding response OmpR family regulator